METEDRDCEKFEIRMKILVREWDESAAHRRGVFFFFPEEMGFDNSTLTRWNLVGRGKVMGAHLSAWLQSSSKSVGSIGQSLSVRG